MLRIAVVLLVAAAAALTGCTKTHAKTIPMLPAPLITPAPPDRVIVPAPQPVAVQPPSQEPVAPPAVPPQPETAPARGSSRSQPTPPPAASPPEPVASPPPVLQTTPNPSEVAEQASALLAAAQRDLDQLKPYVPRMSANARVQYDSARGFIHQAEDALRIKNVVLARDLADKAASLASQLKR